jgi:hypothetical protein
MVLLRERGFRGVGVLCRIPAGFIPLIFLWALLPAAADGAVFGVPGGTPPNPVNNPPPGYFMLVGADAIQAGLTYALGDIPHTMTLYIEHTRNRLDIDLYDPGLYNPNLALGVQLDSSFSATDYVGQMRFTLISPGLAQLAQQTYGADTAVTNRLIAHFYNANEPPGTYYLVCELMDTAGKDEDVNVFGVSVPNEQIFSYNYCVGHNGQGGATISDPIALYPYLNYASASEEAGGPVCGLDFLNYDMDAAVNGVEPPSMGLITRRGYVFPPDDAPDPSTNMSFWYDRYGIVPYGELDSDDHGIWRWEYLQVGSIQDLPSPDLPSPFDMNAFSMQVYDYGQPSPMWQEWPFDPSFLHPPDDRHPRRIYLPRDDGSWPQKEYMGHSARVTAGEDPITETMQSTIEVTLEVANPREYDITILDGATYVNPSSEFFNLQLTNAGNNMTAAVDGGDPKRINLSGSVPAGTTETITYTVDVIPSSPGIKFVTGDGVDFTGGADRQTFLRYTTPVTLIYDVDGDVFGPLCALYFTAEPAICTATAVAVPSATAFCPGGSATLDGSGSTVHLCPGGGNIEYQWRADGNIIRAYPASDTITESPTQTTTYTLEVRCSTERATCKDSVDIPITVYTAPLPKIDPANPEICPGGSVVLTLTNPGDYVWYQWTTNPPGGSGDGATNTPSVTAQVVGTQYTLNGRTSDNCTVQTSVTIRQRTLAPPPIDPQDPRICQGEWIQIQAVGTFASCSWATVPAGAPGDGSTSCSVSTNQPGVQYTVTVTDALGCTAQASVTTQDVADNVPPALGNTLLMVKEGNDVRIDWVDLAMTVGEYRIHNLDGDADFDGVPDTLPTPANLSSAPHFIAAPGLETYGETGGVDRPSFLVFYRIRAASDCFFTPGPL